MKLLPKLRSRSGESFTELLCAIVIMSLGMALLAGMVSSASSLNARAAAKDDELYTALASAEQRETAVGEPETITVTIDPSRGNPGLDFQVTYFGMDDELCAYYAEVG